MSRKKKPNEQATPAMTNARVVKLGDNYIVLGQKQRAIDYQISRRQFSLYN